MSEPAVPRPRRAPIAPRLERRVVQTLIGIPPRWASRLAGKGVLSGCEDGELDPTIRLMLALQRWRRLGGFTGATPQETRLRMRAQMALIRGTPTPVAYVRELRIPGPDRPLVARHYAPPAPAEGRPLLVFFHGGGFVAGDLDGHDEPCRMLCRHGALHVLSIDYRLAPEHPFPAGVEDAFAAAQWAMRHADELGADPGHVGVGGDSAGGNLATVACLLAARRGAPMPAAQLLIYPPTDHHTAWPSRAAFAEGPLLTNADIDFFHRHYAPDVPPDDERHSPLRATDLRGLPPALVVTAAFDPLRDEGEAYAAALRAAGNEVITWRVPGMVHGFVNLSSVCRTARDHVIAIAGATRALMSGVPAVHDHAENG